ncbi:MAG: YqgE/AlgH family protein [Rhodospirillales bacterium]|nr:YqgE/AlgH family protein [Rhodospirillales bacterium]
MPDETVTDPYFTGQLLIAMPGMRDERFAHTVIYMCAHSEEGAMGLVLNQVLDSLSFDELMSQLGVSEEKSKVDIPVHFGGPVEAGRGFVLHTNDFNQDATLVVDDEIALTATVDILKAIAGGYGPRRSLLALGYAGWGPGQLDQEIRANGWLQVPADSEIIFDSDFETKWERSIGVLGVDPRMLSGEAGHA